jgi:hypothetical protein
MPVPVAQLHMAQLDLGLRSSAHEILSFLGAHPDLAYNTKELIDELRPADDDAFREALLFLSDIGAVDERIVHGLDYYLFVADVEGLKP